MTISSESGVRESKVRQDIRNIISEIPPYDEIEASHIKDALEWIDSGVEIFRIEKPATPPKHLVCFTVFVDPDEGKVLLLDHIKAQRQIPNGGHVNVNEMPEKTVVREIEEEMSEETSFLFDEKPFFLSIVETVGLIAGHFDVDLWYALRRDSNVPINDQSEMFKLEFSGYQWLTFDEVLALDLSQSDPNIHRFVLKLRSALSK